MLMILNRDYVHCSTVGRSVAFKKGVPTHVPPRVVPEIVALGGEAAANQDVQTVQEALGAVQAVEASAADRAASIEAAVRRMLERNQRGDFTAGGRPNLNVLFKETGLTVDTKELEPVWTKIREEMATA